MVAAPDRGAARDGRERTSVSANWPAGTRTEPLPRRLRLRHRPAARRLGDDQGLRRARRHADPGPLRREAQPQRHGDQRGLHRRRARSRPTTTSPRAPARRDPRFTPQFTYKGFQYIQVSAVEPGGGRPLPRRRTVTVDSVQEVRQALRPTGVVRTASAAAGEDPPEHRSSLHENYVASIITDTPIYEKNAWTGDASLSAPTASLMLDTERQFRKVFQDLVENQAPTGELTLLAPTNNYGYAARQTFKSANAGRDADLGRVLVHDPVGVLPALRRPRGLAKTYPAMKNTSTSGSRSGRQGRRHLRVHADVRPRRLVPADRRRRARSARRPAWRSRRSSPRPRPPTSPMRRRSRPTPRARSARRRRRPLRRPVSTKSRRTSTPSGGTRRAASTARTRRRPSRRRCRPSRWPSGWCPHERRRALQEKLIDDVMVTRAGHEVAGIVGSRWIFPVLTRPPRGRSGRGPGGVHDRQADDVPVLRLLGRARLDVAGRVLGGSPAARAPTTCSARSGSGSTRAWPASRPLKPGYAEIAFQPLIARGNRPARGVV